MNQLQPNERKLEQSRAVVRSFLRRKEQWTKGTFYAAFAMEALFFVLCLVFMDFHDRLHWFLASGFLLVYTPLVTMTWRNSIKLDHLYYRLIEELKYGGGSGDTLE
jgi:hypothetical protein